MTFESFAEQHGLIIDHLVYDRWTRVKTLDHPNKRNGSYIYSGNCGALQDWSKHEKPVLWRGQDYKPDPQLAAKRKKSEQVALQRQAAAAKRASWILSQCVETTHPYLASKGFPELKGYVWEGNLVIPMRIDGNISGLQTISHDGTKRFLAGQRNKAAVYIMDNKGVPILCEGMATALSVRRALKAHKTRYKLVVCFSAGNLSDMAKSYPDCVIVADNDPVGIKVAQGYPHWVSNIQKEDFNDAELRLGAYEAGKSLIATFPAALA